MNHLSDKYKEKPVLRGDLYYADLSPVIGSEQGGLRPVLIVQNNTGNRHSPTVIVAAITSRTTKAKLPTHVPVTREESGLKCDSTILLEQVRTIDRCRLKEYIGQLSPGQMELADTALLTSFGLKRPLSVTAPCDGPDSGPIPHVFHAVVITYWSDSLLHMASLCWYFSFVARPPRI